MLSFKKNDIPQKISEKTQGPFIVKYINELIKLNFRMNSVD